MATDTAVMPVEERDHKHKLALLKAVGLDRAAPEQRELALAIADRYELDLLLKHLVLIEGRPYITRDALLWIAHRSGQFDGISVTKPVVEDKHWYAEATVWRKDMTHPFVYGGRYPTTGGNQKFAPEMAVKVAESMALRRAFNISAPSQDERWDVEVPAGEPEPPKSLKDVVEAKAAEVKPPDWTPTNLGTIDSVGGDAAARVASITQAAGEEAAVDGAAPVSPPAGAASAMVQCESRSAFDPEVQCRREQGHRGAHKTQSESWE